MKILTLALGSVVAFLSACATVTPAPVPSVDWDAVIEHVETLAKPNRVQGPVTNRGEAETNDDLWLLSLLQEQASDRDHTQMGEIPKYLRSVAAKAKQVALPKCTLTLRLQRKPCDNGK